MVFYPIVFTYKYFILPAYEKLQEIFILVIELAIPLASGENISDIKSNGIGPNPIEKPKINIQSDINGKMLIPNANWGL